MPDDENSIEQPTPTNGAAEPRPRSFREVAEAAYDSLAEGIVPEDDGEGDGQSSRPRDSLGRFAPKGEEPGEADGDQPTQPRAEQAPEGEQPQPAPDQPGSSIEAPAHWSNADKEMFRKAPPEWQAWGLRRDSEMTADYQRKVQSTAQAAQFVSAIAPVFQHPALQQSMRQEGISPVESVNRAMGFQIRVTDPDPNVRAGALRDLAQVTGLDPAAVFGLSRPAAVQVPDGIRKEPAFQYITDHLQRSAQEVAQLKQSFFQMQQAAQQQAMNAQAQVDAENLRQQYERINDFEREVDRNGKQLHPHFGEVLPIILDLFKANPQRNLKDTYEQAIWAHEGVRKRLMSEQAASLQAQQSLSRARQAIRSNTRGMTVPVTGERREGPQGLRAAIEAAVEEVGYGT